MSDPGQGAVRLQTPKPVSKPPTWAELLAQIEDLEKRLDMLEEAP